MFELSVACKYLTPRWRQLSVSIISTISICVIALVVWLIVVFFSVTHGLERSWIQKLVALTAPIRITPTDAYYQSYYYLVDGLSASSDYSTKDISEKRLSAQSDPYDPQIDAEVPHHWKKPDLHADGTLKDIVKLAYHEIEGLTGISGLMANDYEIASGTLRLRIARGTGKQSDALLSQVIYLGSFDPKNPILQNTILPLSGEDIGNVMNLNTPSPSSLLLHQKILANGSTELELPSSTDFGDGILLPKSFRDAGALIGDRGHLSYYAPTMSAVQEQRLPIYVAGFYDPGIIPMGGKYALVNQEIARLMRASQSMEEGAMPTNGINLRFDDIDQADRVKAVLQAAFQQAGISPYWRIETYREYEFTKDLLQQLSSEKNLWSLLATVIIIVACSNIISMLIILVNDKKVEIGILRSMGASSGSIATIFGICGVVMGMAGSIIGTLVAVVTLHNLQALVDFIGRIQGYEMFNPLFYGSSLPNEMSVDALLFVVIATSAISLVAGIVPAIKACCMRPSTILRAE